MREPATNYAPMVDAPRTAGAASASQLRVLILSASAGAGHMTAAEAVRAALRAATPTARVEVVDVLGLANPFFRRLYAEGYLALVNHAPSAMGWLYEVTDRPNQKRRDRLRAAFQNMNLKRVAERLVREQPHLIINTHFLPAELVAGLRRQGRINCRQVTVTTDFETHRMWVQEPTERYYTATTEGRACLGTWGVAPERVLVSGIPVRDGFGRAPDRLAARALLNCASDRPLVLLLCGGFGVGPTETLLLELLRTPPDTQVIAITGRNEKLRARLTAIVQRRRRDVRITGFVDAMEVYMAAADLVVSKPGGLTASETLAVGRPSVIVNPIPGQETRNSDFLLERGAGVKVNNLRMLGYRVAQLLRDASELRRLGKAAASLGRPMAAENIAQDALSLAVAPAV